MVLILAELFDKVPVNVFDKVMYLLQGRVAPLYIPLTDVVCLQAVTKA